MAALVFSCEKEIEVEQISYFQIVKDTFDIKMLGCSDAGYIWFFVNEPSANKVKVIKESSFSANPGYIGGYNYQVFTLVALEPGKEVLKFEEYQPWQKSKSVIAKTRYTVN